MERSGTVRFRFHRLHLAVLAAGAGLLVSEPPVAVAAPAALEEVVVTARRREESVQEVPIAVSAFSAEQLAEAGVSNVKDLGGQVPGLTIDSQSTAQIWVRGIGQRDDSARVDSPVGVYIDGIYIARKDAQLLDMVDVESVQVLRGPQGTLFGKNTTGGALVLTTKKPDHELGARVDVRVGNYNRRDAKVVADVPLVEDLLLSKITLGSIKRDGYLTNVVDGRDMASEDRQSAALQLRWLPSDTVTVDGFIYAGKTREVQPAAGCKFLSNSSYGGQDALYQNQVWPGDTQPVWPDELMEGPAPAGYTDVSQAYQRDCAASAEALRHNRVSNNMPHAQFGLDNYLVGITVEWEISDTLAFKSITGWGSQKLSPFATYGDNDGTAGLYSARYQVDDSDREQISQEFQFTGSALDDRLQYTAGLFGMVEDMDEGLVAQYAAPAGLTPERLAVLPGFMVLTPATVQQDKFDLKNTTLAAFFQSSYDITDDWQATVGLRWTSEKRDMKDRQRLLDTAAYYNHAAATLPGMFFFNGTPLLPMAGNPLGRLLNSFGFDHNGVPNYPLGPETRQQIDDTWEELSPMASIRYTVPQDWLDGTFVDSAMTYFTYSEGFKSGTFEPVGADGLMTVEPETVKNFELGFKLDAFDRTTRLNVAVFHMEYDDMQLRQVIADSNGAPKVVLTNASASEIDGVEVELLWSPIEPLLVTVGASYNDYDFKDFMDGQLSAYHSFNQLQPPQVDRSGETFPEVPEKTANVAVQYTFDLGDFGTLTPRVQYNYVGEIFMGLDAGAWSVRDQATFDAYDLWGARLTYRSPDQKFEITAYGENLTNETYYVGAAAVGDSVGTFTLQKGLPRMYGVELSYRFGGE